MTAEVQTQPNGTTAPAFKIVERLDSVPVVHDSVAYAQTLINSTQLTSNLYQTAVGIAARSYEIASPVLTRAKPLIDSADNLAVATVDRAEATFPYPFKTPTEELVGVKQAKAVYDARVAPLLHRAEPAIQDVIAKTTAINQQLGARASDAIQQTTEISHHLLENLKALADQGKELPHQLLEGLGKVTNDVKTIVLAKDVTVQDKTNKLGAYVVDQVKPIVDEIYRHVIGATKAANEQLEQAKETIKQKAAPVVEKVAPVVEQAEKPAPAAAQPESQSQ